MGCTYLGVYKVTPGFKFTPKPPDRSMIKNLDRMERYMLKGLMHPDFTPNFQISQHQVNKEYRSIFGPFFHISELRMPGAGAGEYRTMTSRMLADRLHGCACVESCCLCSSVPRNHTFNSWLKWNQDRLPRRIRSSLQQYKKWFYSRIEYQSEDTLYEYWVNKPHVKKKLRVRKFLENSDRCNDNYDDRKPVGFKPKPHELLNEGKKRAVGDLGQTRTNRTAWCFDSFKHAMSGTYEHGNYKFTFVDSPRTEVLQRTFTDLLTVDSGKLHFVFYSDDGAIAVHCSDGLLLFNTDLKQCDGSHFGTFLEMVEDFLSSDDKGSEHVFTGAVRTAYGYLKCPMEVIHPESRKKRILYEFTTPRMYSGFAGTTITNNFANLCIGFCLQRRLPNPGSITKSQLIAIFERSAADAGYICHLDICQSPEDLQFLKHSPVRCEDGHYVPTMNLGVYLRGFGTFPGDLPGRGSYETRARAFISDVVRARDNWGNHSFNDAFAHLKIDHAVKFGRNHAYGVAFELKRMGDAGERIPLSSLCNRYRISEDDLRELCGAISNSNVGCAINLPIVQAIYRKDYG